MARLARTCEPPVRQARAPRLKVDKVGRIGQNWGFSARQARARLFMHARRRDPGLSISSCPKFEKMVGLMDVPGTAYTAQEPYLDWHTEEIGRLEEMSCMEELRGLASKIRIGRVPFLARQAPATVKVPPFDWGEPQIATLHVAFKLDSGGPGDNGKEARRLWKGDMSLSD